MDLNDLKKYFADNRINLFLYSLILASMTYFISDVGMTLITALLFLVVVVMDYRNYKKLQPAYWYVKNVPADLIGGILLIIAPFANYIVDPFHTSPSFGNIDVAFVLVGLTVSFYGAKKLYEFYLPVGFVLAIAAFEFLMGTYLMQDILGPAFIQFTIYFAVHILNLFGYSVIAGPDYFILPDGSIIYMLVWCSGIESFTLFTLLMIVLLLREKINWPIKVLLISVGAVGDLFINVIRVAILVAIAIDYGMSMMEVFHSNLGNILFLIYVVLFYFAAVKFFVRND